MNVPIPDRHYRVIVIVYAYNHEIYIEDAIKSIVTQKTNFPYKVLVIDDKSSDKTAERIREYELLYPSLVHGIYMDSNTFSRGDCFHLDILSQWYENSEYQAYCDGDDYWTDSFKLQKQVDFMEGCPDCTLCFHNALEIWENKSKENRLFSLIEDRVYSGEEIYEKWIVPTSSIMFRSSVSKSKIVRDRVKGRFFLLPDIALFLSCALEGCLCGISDTMSVYRRSYNSFTIQESERQKRGSKHNFKMIEHDLSMIEAFGDRYKQIGEQKFYTHCFNFMEISLFKFNIRLAIQFLGKAFHYSITGTIRSFSSIISSKIRTRLHEG